MTYRVRGETRYGFTWRTNAQDITPGTAGQWIDINLTAYVASDATGAIVEVVNNHPSNALSAVVRGKEDTREYMPVASSQQIGGRGHRWQIVKMDSSKLIQGYVEDTVNISLKLIGHTFGTDPSYFEQPPDITPGTTGSWTTVDVSAHVDADADGVTLMIDSVGNDSAYAIREVGSSDNDTANVINGQGNTLYVVGIDGLDQFDAYLATADIDIYLIAQTKGSLVFYPADVAVSDPSLNSWQGIDADTYSVPWAANGLILRAENEQNKRNDIGFRHGDSADDWNKQLWNNGHFQAAIGLNDANVWDEYMGSVNVNVAIAAHTVSVVPDYDVHADIDVLVREDVTGAVRAVLATDVATTTDIIGGDWATYTGTFTPTEYTVVAPTDYLEIDLFAHFTRNDGASAKLDFSISDVSLPTADRTAVDNVALMPE